MEGKYKWKVGGEKVKRFGLATTIAGMMPKVTMRRFKISSAHSESPTRSQARPLLTTYITPRIRVHVHFDPRTSDL